MKLIYLVLIYTLSDCFIEVFSRSKTKHYDKSTTSFGLEIQFETLKCDEKLQYNSGEDLICNLEGIGELRFTCDRTQGDKTNMNQLELISHPVLIGEFPTLYRNVAIWIKNNLSLTNSNRIILKDCEKYPKDQRWNPDKEIEKIHGDIKYNAEYSSQVLSVRKGKYFIKPQVSIGGNIVNILAVLCKNSRFIDHDEGDEILCKCLNHRRNEDCYGGYLIWKILKYGMEGKTKIGFYIRNGAPYLKENLDENVKADFGINNEHYIQNLKNAIYFLPNSDTIPSNVIEYRSFNRLCFEKYKETEGTELLDRLKACLAFLRIDKTFESEDLIKLDENHDHHHHHDHHGGRHDHDHRRRNRKIRRRRMKK